MSGAGADPAGGARRGSKRGARLLVQVAANPECRLMTVAAAAGLPLPALEATAGRVGDAPVADQSVSRLAMANGNRFEVALWRDGRLVEAMVAAGLLPRSPFVVDYRPDRRPVERIEREVLTHLRAAAAGEGAPDLLCHPPLRLAVAPDFALALTPDYLRLVRAPPAGRGGYVPGEIKAFHDLGAETDDAALFAATRQVAAYDLALDAAAAALGLAPAPLDRADLVLRRPRARDLRPALRPDLDTRPHKDWVRRAALPALARAREELLAYRAAHGRDPDLTALPTNLVDACANVCPGFHWCLERARARGDLALLGDAAELFAPATSLEEALALLRGEPGAHDDPARRALAARLAERSAWTALLRAVPPRRTWVDGGAP